VLIVSPHEPEIPVAEVVKTWTDMKGYFRVRDHGRLPSLGDTDLMMTNGTYTEVKPNGPSMLTLIPPSLIGPPEFVHIDMKDTDKPGVVVVQKGSGVVGWIPWDPGGPLLSRKSSSTCRFLSRSGGSAASAQAVADERASHCRDDLDATGRTSTSSPDQSERAFPNRILPTGGDE
jgi:hypothetical protein